MPFLGKNTPEAMLRSVQEFRQGTPAITAGENRRKSPSMFPVCANPGCTSGRFRLWRNRQAPVLEGGWACGPDCMRVMVRGIITREMDGREAQPVAHRHRVPLGLVMLAQGWITHAQLKTALEAQKQAGVGRLGAWLVEHHGVDEQLVTRGLGVQWNCPVFSLDGHHADLIAPLVPRLFIDTFGILPVRVTSSRNLHIGFEENIDRCVSFAVERMTGLPVEAGLVHGPDFRRAHRQMLAAAYPKTRIIEANGVEALTRTLAGIIEEAKPVEAKLVRIHDFFWLRMWRSAAALSHRLAVPPREAVEDVLCSLTQFD